MKQTILLTLLTISYSLSCAYTEDLDKMRDTIRYGTDSEIAALLKTVKSSKITELDDDLSTLAIRSKNEMIVNALFSYFMDGEKKGLEDKAIGILENREENEKTSVSAIEYLGAIKEKKAKDILKEIISKDESPYINSAVKALGKIAREMGSGVSNDTAEYLIAYYTDKSPKLDTCREIIIALGSTGSKESLDFLCKIIDDDDEESSYLKIASLTALGEIKDQGTLETILKATQSTDASVKSSAVAALGGFNDAKADEAIIDAFRDSFFRTRLSAVKAAGERKLSAAIPYLRYRAINDDAASVREESVSVLGAMNKNEAGSVLLEILEDKKINDKIRISCAQALLKNEASQYCERIIELAEDAKAKKYTMLYSGLLKALSTAKSAKLKDFAARLFTSKDVTDNAIALDITANNSFGNFKEEVQRISETKNSTLAAKALKILSSL
ncbi:MAG: HEAT repeat domain-containing protein [Termitinemataceae bacterium]|nr:MAG: HEAT repeat domain-containing protein [Termitinemataceae bacterium]